MTLLFKGVTDEYRKTDEYKNLVKVIKENEPKIAENLYLIELAICMHKNNPQLYKEEGKHKKCKNCSATKPAASAAECFASLPTTRVLTDNVRVYDDPEHPDLKTPMVPILEAAV